MTPNVSSLRTSRFGTVGPKPYRPSPPPVPPVIWHELPVIAARFQRELDDAERVVVTDFEVRHGRAEAVQTFAAAGADGDLANPERGVRGAVGAHRLEALVRMIVAVQH